MRKQYIPGRVFPLPRGLASSCTHRIGLVGHKVSETVKVCIAAIYTKTRNDSISFFKIPSLVVLTQRLATHGTQSRDIGAFCIETHFTEERLELESTTEATVYSPHVMFLSQHTLIWRHPTHAISLLSMHSIEVTTHDWGLFIHHMSCSCHNTITLETPYTCH